jgi:hypothetical protein
MNISNIYKKNKMNSLNRIFLFFILIFSFYFKTSFAAETFRDMVERIISTIIKPVGGLFVSAALVAFVWGITKYMKGGGMEKDDAKQLMFWGLIGLTVISAVGAFVAAFKNTLGV